MTLGELIEALEHLPGEQTFKWGFSHPHSFRGYYEQLAFEPKDNTTVMEMLEDARKANGSTYTGWKGGEFRMGLGTPVWLATDGCSGCELTEDVLHMLASVE